MYRAAPDEPDAPLSCSGCRRPCSMAQQRTVVPRSGRRGRRFKSCHPDQCHRSLICGHAVPYARRPTPQQSRQRPRGNKKETRGNPRESRGRLRRAEEHPASRTTSQTRGTAESFRALPTGSGGRPGYRRPMANTTCLASHDHQRMDFHIHQQRCPSPPCVVNRHLAETGVVTSSGTRRLRARGSRPSHTCRRTPGVDPRQPRQTSPASVLSLSGSARGSSSAVVTMSAAIRPLGRARVFSKA
jgi:hypothetical protein